MTLSISVYSDVICPWCFVGKRRLERALDELGLRHTARIEWLPFELNPDMPDSGIERSAYRAAKFGAERSARLDAEMTERGRDEGIAFAFDRIRRTPSTRKAHLLIAFATSRGVGDAIKEALMRAYFEEARDIGDPEILAEVAHSLGLDRDEAASALSDPGLAGQVEALERQAARLGVSGVPFFIVDGAWAVSGAQPSEDWVSALRERTSIPEGVPA